MVHMQNVPEVRKEKCEKRNIICEQMQNAAAFHMTICSEDWYVI